MRRIDRHGLPAKVLENPLNDRRLLDAGNDAQPTAALPAGLDVDGEYALEALGPGHPPLPFGDRCFGTCSDGGTAGGPGYDLSPVWARRCEHPVVPGQVGAGLRHQRGEAGNKVFRLEHHVRGTVAIRRLQRVAHVTAAGQGQPAGGDRRT